MKIVKGFFPNGRWFAGLTMLLVLYVGYTTVGPVVETILPNIAQPLTSPWGNEVISNMVGNFWWGIVIIAVGFLGYLLMAGIPGTDVESYENY
jgi:hypothetical protein